MTSSECCAADRFVNHIRGQEKAYPAVRSVESVELPGSWDATSSRSFLAASGDDPRPRIEEHALIGLVCAEEGAQSVARLLSGRGVQPGEQHLRLAQAEHNLLRGGDIRAVVDRLVHVGELD